MARVFPLSIWVDGGCRGNGNSDAIAAAAAISLDPWSGRHYEQWTTELPDYPTPTSTRAEIKAVILALEKSLDIYTRFNDRPWLDVKIHSDSIYTVDCMTHLASKWSRNGWVSNTGNPIANSDLLGEALYLTNSLSQLGNVSFTWVPREQNQDADALVNDALDQMKYSGSDEDSGSDSDSDDEMNDYYDDEMYGYSDDQYDSEWDSEEEDSDEFEYWY